MRDTAGRICNFDALTRNEDAYKLALRLNKKLRITLFLLMMRTPSVTVSIGVAEYKEEWTKEKFIDKVDQLLYQAKANGKTGLKQHFSF